MDFLSPLLEKNKFIFINNKLKHIDSYHIITMEKPTKIKKVLLIANIANVQKFISPSSKKCCIKINL